MRAECMISDETRNYIGGLVDYYVSEAASYMRIADSCKASGSVTDTALGMIIGCVYSGFLQTCRDQGTTPKLEEINDVVALIRDRIPAIKKALEKT